jgi:hypothetical protein
VISGCERTADIPAPTTGFSGFALDSAVPDPRALVVVYLIIGILYESYIHPVTILSTLLWPAPEPSRR